MKPKDYIAIICIVGFFAGKYMGFNGQLDAAIMLILGYYFVKREQKLDNGR